MIDSQAKLLNAHIETQRLKHEAEGLRTENERLRSRLRNADESLDEACAHTDEEAVLVGLDELATKWLHADGIAGPFDYSGQATERAFEKAASLRSENERLTAAIRKHRDQKADDRCWLDDDELYAVLGEDEPETTLPPECEFLESCRRFWRQRQFQPVLSDPNAMTMRQLQDRIAELEGIIGNAQL